MKRCHNKGWAADKLEALVWTQIERILANPSLMITEIEKQKIKLPFPSVRYSTPDEIIEVQSDPKNEVEVKEKSSIIKLEQFIKKKEIPKPKSHEEIENDVINELELPSEILEIDEELFILDVKKGALGGFVAGRMLFPYLGLKGLDYLKQNEVELKKEVIRGDIEYIIHQYGEASRGMIIDPEYFTTSYISRLSKTFPPIRYSYLNTFRSDLRDKNIAKVMPGYESAIEKLVNDGILQYESKGISINEDFIKEISICH